MKKQLFLPVVSVAAGAACFALRLLQNKTGFEASTGLPISGNIPAIALIALLAFLSIGLFFAVRTLRAEVTFPADFSVQDASLLTLPVMGILLLAASGLLDAFATARPGLIPFAEVSASPSLQFLFALSAVGSAAALFSAVSTCRVHSSQEIAQQKLSSSKRKGIVANPSSHHLLAVPVCLVVRLVLTYRSHSVNPSLAAYYVELLTLVVLTLAFFRLSSCAVQPTSSGRLGWYCCLSVVLSITVMADPLTLSTRLLYVGSCLTLLGFLILQCLRNEST